VGEVAGEVETAGDAGGSEEVTTEGGFEGAGGVATLGSFGGAGGGATVDGCVSPILKSWGMIVGFRIVTVKIDANIIKEMDATVIK